MLQLKDLLKVLVRILDGRCDVASVSGFGDTAVVDAFIPATKRFKTSPDSPKVKLDNVEVLILLNMHI
jgi:hypothetical protein